MGIIILIIMWFVSSILLAVFIATLAEVILRPFHPLTQPRIAMRIAMLISFLFILIFYFNPSLFNKLLKFPSQHKPLAGSSRTVSAINLNA